MKRIILLVVLALIGFYVAWPAWTGYRISKALETQDADLLEAKIDFPAVRVSLKPAVTEAVGRTIEATKRDAGPLGALIAGQLKGDITQRLVDGALNSVVTPPNVIRIAQEGGNFKQSIERAMGEQVGRAVLGGGDGGGRQPGGLGGLAERLGGKRGGAEGQAPAPAKPAEPQAKSDAPKRKFGLANVKRFAVEGPLAFSVGVARDPASAEPDLTAHLRFTGFDWKVVGVVPRI